MELLFQQSVGGGDGDPHDDNNFVMRVKLDDSREIKFDVNPHSEYYFKVNPPPRSGGKKVFGKRNSRNQEGIAENQVAVIK